MYYNILITVTFYFIENVHIYGFISATPTLNIDVKWLTFLIDD